MLVRAACRGVPSTAPLPAPRCRLPPGDGEAPAAAAFAIRPGRLGSRFLQSAHLQDSEHMIPAWKHSQYFFRQPDFLQWHPLLWRDETSWEWAILGRKACGLRSSVAWMATLRLSSFSGLLWQPWQLHAKQYCPLAKHSQ